MTPDEEFNQKWNIRKIIEETIEKSHPKPAPETLSRLDKIDKKMEENYSKRELDEHFGDLKLTLSRIELQTTKTNGRVNNLENHRAYLWGAFTILTLLGGAIIALSISAIDIKINRGIREALSMYNIEVR